MDRNLAEWCAAMFLKLIADDSWSALLVARGEYGRHDGAPLTATIRNVNYG
jgi:hypothetical protein